MKYTQSQVNEIMDIVEHAFVTNREWPFVLSAIRSRLLSLEQPEESELMLFVWPVPDMCEVIHTDGNVVVTDIQQPDYKGMVVCKYNNEWMMSEYTYLRLRRKERKVLVYRHDNGIAITENTSKQRSVIARGLPHQEITITI